MAALRFIVVAAGLFAATASPRPADAQSFDCREARYRDELLICERPGLAQLDQQLATLYRQKIGNIAKERKDEFQQHEVYFLRARRECRNDSHCIEQSYRNRIQELENFASEEERERSSDATISVDRQSERPVRSSDHRSSRSERPLEPSGSSGATTPREPRSRESAASSTATPLITAPEPQSTERSDASRKAARSSEHHNKPNRATTAAAPAAAQPATAPNGTTAAPQPPTARSGTTPQPAASNRQAGTSESPEKPTIQWVNPAPAR